MPRTTEKKYGYLKYSCETDQTEVVLGIDQSLTGFAITFLTLDGSNSETWVFESPLKGVDRLADIQDWLVAKIKVVESRGYTVADAAIESPVRASFSAIISGEIWAATRLVLLSELHCPGRYPLQVAPTTLKKYVTGKGTSSKSEMLLACYKNWGMEFSDDNAADSYGLARIAAKLADTKLRKDALVALSDPKHRDKQLQAV